MAYKTCPDCGSRIFEYGCTWCNEEVYIEMQGIFDEPNKPELMPKEPNPEVSDTTGDAMKNRSL